jgi:CO/xanthine dehydrogenase FAD-binding subunit
MSSFYTGPGETALADGDIITAIEVQLPSLETTDGLHSLAGYQKLNLWEGDFAVVSAAVALRLDESKVIRHAAISVGALAPEPLRLASIEKALVGHRPDRVKLRSNLDALWSKIGHPLRNNEWKLDAATGVVLHAFDDAIASE